MTVYQNISFGLTNIKEEMDEIDFDARAAARMIEILQKPQDVVRAINECVDKKKKLNMDKAYLRLIDLYEISLFTAKALMGMKLHEAGDPKAAAAQEIKKLEEKLAACRRAQEACGSDYVRLQELTDEQERLSAELDEKTERWVYLNDLKEKIDAQNSQG